MGGHEHIPRCGAKSTNALSDEDYERSWALSLSGAVPVFNQLIEEVMGMITRCSTSDRDNTSRSVCIIIIRQNTCIWNES